MRKDERVGSVPIVNSEVQIPVDRATTLYPYIHISMCTASLLLDDLSQTTLNFRPGGVPGTVRHRHTVYLKRRRGVYDQTRSGVQPKFRFAGELALSRSRLINGSMAKMSRSGSEFL